MTNIQYIHTSGSQVSNINQLLIREQVIKAIRAFFDEQGFHEIITPVLNGALPLEENLFAFKTTWSTVTGQQSLYLPTSPESNLKKLLAQGIGNCYSIGHTFRNLENSGSLHSPEFLMLEWYREDAKYSDIMTDVRNLIGFVSRRLSTNSSQSVGSLQLTDNFAWPELSLELLFKEKADIDLQASCKEDNLFMTAKEKGYEVTDASWSQLFDQIFLNEIESHLPKEPFFLVDFPARMSPLCMIQKDKPYLAERFEFYLEGIEIGNGNTENLDAEAVLLSFKHVANIRQQTSKDSHPYDLGFIEALRTLSKTGKSYAGIGLGVERLAMVLTKSDSL